MQSTKQYFPALTGIRALAAYSVFFTHYNPFQENSRLGLLLREGNSGVTVFFVLSGFLIATRYGGQEMWQGKKLVDYFRNRIARIYPVYFLVTTATFLTLCLRPDYDLIGSWLSYSRQDKVIVTLLNYTLTKAFFYPFVFTGVAQGWTLTIEECFYALAPLLLLGLIRGTKKYALLAAYSVSLLIIGCGIVAAVPHKLGFFNSFNFMFTYTFFGRATEFLVGMGLALFLKRNTTSQSTGFYTWGGVVWILACVVAGSFINPTPPTPEAYSAGGILLNNFVMPLGIAALFRGLVTERTWFRRVLETSFFDLLGKSSYCFYLIHFGVLALFIKRHITGNPLFIFPIMIMLSILVYQLVEEPLQKKLRARVHKS